MALASHTGAKKSPSQTLRHTDRSRLTFFFYFLTRRVSLSVPISLSLSKPTLGLPTKPHTWATLFLSFYPQTLKEILYISSFFPHKKKLFFSHLLRLIGLMMVLVMPVVYELVKPALNKTLASPSALDDGQRILGPSYSIRCCSVRVNVVVLGDFLLLLFYSKTSSTHSPRAR